MQVVTQFGRPNWPKIIGDVADNHPGQSVGVFVCGPPPFTKAIRHACQNFNAHASTRIKVCTLACPRSAAHFRYFEYPRSILQHLSHGILG